MLSERKKEELKEWLTQRLNEILGNANDTLVDIADFKDSFTDQMDQASLDAGIGLALRIREREAKLVRKIRDTLSRLEEGTFGICEDCGEEISPNRLMVRPVTTLCIDCKKEQESAEKAGMTK